MSLTRWAQLQTTQELTISPALWIWAIKRGSSRATNGKRSTADFLSGVYTVTVSQVEQPAGQGGCNQTRRIPDLPSMAETNHSDMRSTSTSHLQISQTWGTKSSGLCGWLFLCGSTFQTNLNTMCASLPKGTSLPVCVRKVWVLDDAGSDHGRNLVPARLACFHLFSTVSDISHSVLWMYLYKINFVHLLILLLARRWDSPGEIAPPSCGEIWWM